MSKWTEAKDDFRARIAFVLRCVCESVCVQFVFIACSERTFVIFVMKNRSLQYRSELGSSGMLTRRVTVYSVQQAHRTSWTHRKTRQYRYSIIQLSVTFTSHSSVTVCYSPFSLGPPLISQHLSLPYSVSLPVGSVHLYNLRPKQLSWY